MIAFQDVSVASGYVVLEATPIVCWWGVPYWQSYVVYPRSPSRDNYAQHNYWTTPAAPVEYMEGLSQTVEELIKASMRPKEDAR